MKDTTVARAAHDDEGVTLTELLVACAIAGMMTALAMPQVSGFQQGRRTAAAARYLQSRLQLARMEALKRSAHVALAFSHVAGEYVYATYVDGNGNGVRTAEIASQVDPSVSGSEPLRDQFPGVTFGIVDGTPSIDGDGPLTGADPIRVGRSGLVSFSPLGGATPGTIYVRGTEGSQWAVRTTGATGRVRVLEFDAAGRQWRVR
jgi:type II secretory pathway pseudopilin PulG